MQREFQEERSTGLNASQTAEPMILPSQYVQISSHHHLTWAHSADLLQQPPTSFLPSSLQSIFPTPTRGHAIKPKSGPWLPSPLEREKVNILTLPHFLSLLCFSHSGLLAVSWKSQSYFHFYTLPLLCPCPRMCFFKTYEGLIPSPSLERSSLT